MKLHDSPARAIWFLLISLLFLFPVLSFTQPVAARTNKGQKLWIPHNSAGLAPALDTPTTNVIVALAPISRTVSVELVSLTLDANIAETAGHTTVSGYSTFKLHNTDDANPVSTTVGFPEWAGGALSFDPAKFTTLQVTTENKKVPLTPAPAPVKIGKDTRTVNWWTFTLNLDPDEKQVVRVDFAQDLGTDIFPRFTYGLLPSTGWKGSIGSVRLTVRFPTPTQGDQFLALDPTLPKFDGESVTWLWTDLDPTADPGITFMRFSLWQDLLNRRAAVASSPDDSNAHLNLARVYQQLASVDSPRRDNFMSGAVAELETAARLNNKNADAVSLLAQVYETRAGAATGPRDVKYVALALAQWQALIGSRLDADARKQAAEDSFYLGTDARGSGDNALALKYFADAAKLAPQGAGPLYSKERWQTETQAAHVALAQAAIKDGDVATALSHARSAFGNDFNVSPALPLPGWAMDRATIKTGANERDITLHLLTYPAASDEARQVLTELTNKLNQTNAATVELAAREAGYTLSLRIPFGNDRDLTNRLHLLSKTLPEREDWDVMRGVLDTPALQWTETEDTFSRMVHYQEEVDLAAGEAPLRANLAQLGQMVSQLEKSSPQDNRSQMRLALLRDAQQWWEHELTSRTVSYRVEPSTVDPQEWTLKAGERTTLTYDASGIRPEWYIVGAVGALAGITLLATIVLVLRRVWRRSRRE